MGLAEYKGEVLQGSSNLLQWESDVLTYLTRYKAAHRVLKGIEKEPYRRAPDPGQERDEIVHPKDECAGDAPPAVQATSFTPRRELTPHEATAWEKWAEKELLCRSTILSSIPRDIREAVAHRWCSTDILAEVRSLFEIDVNMRKVLNVKELQALHLAIRSTDSMNAYRTQFQILKNEATRLESKLPDWQLKDFFMEGLPQDLRADIQREIRSRPDIKTDELVKVFQRFTEEEQIASRQRAVAAIAFQRHTEFYVKSPDYQTSKGKGDQGGWRKNDFAKNTKHGRNDEDGQSFDGENSVPDPQRPSRNRPWCTNCKTMGHTVDRCRRQSKPPKAGKKGEKVDQQNTQHRAAMCTCEAAVEYEDAPIDEDTQEIDDDLGQDVNYHAAWAAIAIETESCSDDDLGSDGTEVIDADDDDNFNLHTAWASIAIESEDVDDDGLDQEVNWHAAWSATTAHLEEISDDELDSVSTAIPNVNTLDDANSHTACASIAVQSEVADDDEDDDLSTELIVPFTHLVMSAISTAYNHFFIDSASTTHLSNNREALSRVKPCGRMTLLMAGPADMSTKLKGVVRLQHGEEFGNVYYMPQARSNLLSLDRLIDAGWDVNFKDNYMLSPTGVRIELIHEHRLWRVALPIEQTTEYAAAVEHVDDPLLQWHRRLGHVSKKTLVDLSKANAIPIPHDVAKASTFKTDDCVHCITASASKAPDAGIGAPRGSIENGLHIHADLTGLIMTSADGKRYGLVGKIDVLNHRFFHGLKTKSAAEVAALLDQEMNRAERVANLKFTAATTDGGGEFKGETEAMFKRRGVIQYVTTTDSSHLNGVAESVVRVLKRRAMAVLSASGLGASYWTYAMHYAAVSFNKTTLADIKKADGTSQTAWEIITGRRPNLSAMLAFGTLVVANIPKIQQSKQWFTEKGRLARVLTQDYAVHGFRVRYEDDFTVDNIPSVTVAPKYLQAEQPRQRYPEDPSVPRVWNEQPIQPSIPLSNWTGRRPAQPLIAQSPTVTPGAVATSSIPTMSGGAAGTTSIRHDLQLPGRSNNELRLRSTTPEQHPRQASGVDNRAEASVTSHGQLGTQMESGTTTKTTDTADTTAEKSTTTPTSATVTTVETGVTTAASSGPNAQRSNVDATTVSSTDNQQQPSTSTNTEQQEAPTKELPAPRRSTRERKPSAKKVANDAQMAAHVVGKHASSRRQTKTRQHSCSKFIMRKLLKCKPRAHRPDSLAAFAMCAYAMSADDEDPKTYREAMKAHDADKWRAAMEAELDALSTMGTWMPAKLPPGRKLIGTRWLYKRKRNAAGWVVKHKGRVIAQGWSQRPGFDFEKSFAPTARIASVRLVLIVAATRGMIVEQGDVSNAFLNSKIDRDIYVRAPEGYKLPPGFDCLQLLKALYGTRQAGHQWWQTVKTAFEEIGLKPCASDWCVYTMGTGDEFTLVLVYVDDLIVASKSQKMIDSIFEKLGQKWKLTRSGSIDHLLGIKVTRKQGAFHLSQPAYIDVVAKRFPEFPTTTGKYAPLPPGAIPASDLEHKETDEPVSQQRYQELAGCLQWIAGATRPDIAFAASMLARYCHAPTMALWNRGLRVVAYLLHTKDKELVLGGQYSPLVAHSDADWGGCEATGRSTSGYITMFCGSPVTWSSRRQPTVATSTMVAEYVAMFEAAKDVTWLREYLSGLGFPQTDATPLYCDNQPATQLADNPFKHTATKHLSLKYHYVREQAQAKAIKIVLVKGQDQVADGLTKALPGPAHARAVQAYRLA